MGLVWKQDWMLLRAIFHRNLQCQVHESRQIGSDQTGDDIVNINILGISELRWTGMGEFNSDDIISTTGGKKKWSSHHSQQKSPNLFQNFPQFIVIHTVKGFGIVNKAEIDVFLELSCFFHELGKYFPLLIIRSRISVSI